MICLGNSRSAVLTLEEASSITQGLAAQIPGPILELLIQFLNQFLIQLGWGWRMCRCIKVPGDADAAGLEIALGEPWPWFAGAMALVPWTSGRVERGQVSSSGTSPSALAVLVLSASISEFL